ncbi:MAG TPA: thioredoxin domain-containing protein [Steroidobacteraceae bacterium]
MSAGHLKADGTPKYSNHLAAETSPYLQHHAHNPVDWYPWGEEAFKRARAEGKPVHLSIGYSACWWCRVLSEESFEDETTARLLNENFVNIKVDREERPDIDRIYQIAQQMLTQRSGGWPLTMFLTPDDKRPFFGGTYFRDTPRHGMPSFRDVLQRVAAYYREQEPALREQSEALVRAFAELNPAPAAAGTALTAAPLQLARRLLERTFDTAYGGFGGAPKFPHPGSIERLLRDWSATKFKSAPDVQALDMAALTLQRMGAGGIYDQLGGGFSRYSVDAKWMIPHFEKMLYDNGSLLAVYAQAALATGEAFYQHIAVGVADWALREMQAPEGGFYSSFDASSEGHEGKFYAWDRDEVRGALTADEYKMFAPRFGLDRTANFESHWHLHVFQSVEAIAAASKRSSVEVESLLESARAKLLAIRQQRVWPERDEKILVSWNALMIRGLAIAARAFGRDDFEVSASRALDFIRSSMWRNGRLLATYKNGRAHLNAYLDDYAYLADAILELQQLRFRADELAFAQELLEVLLQHFEDPAAGGFFFTSDDHEVLMHRSKSLSDDATPAGNGIAAFTLQRMGYILGERRYFDAAERTLRAAWPALERYPQAHTSLLLALEELLAPTEVVILRGASGSIAAWQRELAKTYAPRRLVLAISSGATHLPPALEAKSAQADAIAYICRGMTCTAPIASLSALAQDLGDSARNVL